MRRIVIIGLGLIGGSMGLALKQAAPDETEVVGYTRSAETATKAIKLGAVDRMESNLASGVDKADLVILATPPMVIKEILEQIGSHLSPDCVVTDAAIFLHDQGHGLYFTTFWLLIKRSIN
ncbi:prephenate dehydrogenase/arogenate dehydrogenase family protein [Chloroflexota bacterium]